MQRKNDRLRSIDVARSGPHRAGLPAAHRKFTKRQGLPHAFSKLGSEFSCGAGHRFWWPAELAALCADDKKTIVCATPALELSSYFEDTAPGLAIQRR